jgi:thiol peroxidase
MDTKTVTMHGNPLRLIGNMPTIGEKVPDCTLVNGSLEEVELSSFLGKVCIIASVPSLDTSVCSTMTHTFSQKIGSMGDEVVFITVSMDLPFAQARWCGAEGVENAEVLSDYRYAQFGQGYGVLLEGLRLLSRAVFVADKEGIIRYEQLVGEIADEPDYEAVLDAAQALIK